MFKEFNLENFENSKNILEEKLIRVKSKLKVY